MNLTTRLLVLSLLFAMSDALRAVAKNARHHRERHDQL